MREKPTRPVLELIMMHPSVQDAFIVFLVDSLFDRSGAMLIKNILSGDTLFVAKPFSIHHIHSYYFCILHKELTLGI